MWLTTLSETCTCTVLLSSFPLQCLVFESSNIFMWLVKPWDRRVSIVTRLQAGWSGVCLFAGTCILCLLQNVQTGSRPTQPPIQWMPGILSPWVNWWKCKGDHSLPFLHVVERDEFICTCMVNVKYCSSIGVVGWNPILGHLATSSDAADQSGWNTDLTLSEVIYGVLLSIACEMDVLK
jgi:hypothetical protein